MARNKQIEARIAEALAVLGELDLPSAQRNERSALVLLALLDLKPTTDWSEANNPLRGVTPIMDFIGAHFRKTYAPNTRETVRRHTIHQFLEAALIVANPDDRERSTNSPKVVYQIEPTALELLRKYGTSAWTESLRKWIETVGSLRERYSLARQLVRVPVSVPGGGALSLSPGEHNALVKLVVEEFASRFTPGAALLYAGDTEDKFALFERDEFRKLGLEFDPHGKMPDLVVYDSKRKWLVLIEVVTSHGPIDGKRRAELQALFKKSTAGLVFVTAFRDRKAMIAYLDQISWETEVWISDQPDHLIHFNGTRFLGPYPASSGG